MVIAIAERMPELGRCYYECVLETTISRHTEYLQARVKLNELAIDDCQLAAAQFVLMCQASLFCPSSSMRRADTLAGAHHRGGQQRRRHVSRSAHEVKSV